MHEKLERELKAAMVMPLEMIAKFLDEECGRDPELVLKIEDEKKTLEKCYRYIEKIAQEVAKNKHSIYIDDPTVYGWAKEYYMKEEELEKESKVEVKELSEEKPKKKSKSKKKKDEKSEGSMAESDLAEPPELEVDVLVVPGGASWLD